jgi:hypothetical protein
MVAGSGLKKRQELVEPLGRGVVRAGRADDVEGVEAELVLQRAERIDLARDADDGEPLEALGSGRLEQGEQRRIAHPHATALRHAFGPGDDDRDRAPAVVGVGGHRENGVDHAGFEQALADPGRDAGPLGTVFRRLQRCPEHPSIGAEEALVAQVGVPGPAVQPGLESRIVGLDELAGPAARLGLAAPRDPAIGAEASGCGRAHGRRPDGRRCRRGAGLGRRHRRLRRLERHWACTSC